MNKLQQNSNENKASCINYVKIIWVKMIIVRFSGFTYPGFLLQYNFPGNAPIGLLLLTPNWIDVSGYGLIGMGCYVGWMFGKREDWMEGGLDEWMSGCFGGDDSDVPDGFGGRTVPPSFFITSSTGWDTWHTTASGVFVYWLATLHAQNGDRRKQPDQAS